MSEESNYVFCEAREKRVTRDARKAEKIFSRPFKTVVVHDHCFVDMMM